MDAEEKQHIESLLKRRRRRLHLLEERAATLSINAPAELVIEIQDLQDIVAQLQTRLDGKEQDSPPLLTAQTQSVGSPWSNSKNNRSWIIPVVIALIGAFATIGAAWASGRSQGSSISTPPTVSAMTPLFATVASTIISTFTPTPPTSIPTPTPPPPTMPPNYVELTSTGDCQGYNVCGGFSPIHKYSHFPPIGKIRYSVLSFDDDLQKVELVCVSSTKDITYLFVKIGSMGPFPKYQSVDIIDVSSGCRIDFTLTTTVGSAGMSLSFGNG